MRLEDVTPAAALADLYAPAASGRCSARAAPRCSAGCSPDGLVDELFLTLSPLITGDDDETGIVAGGRLPEIARFSLMSVHQVGDELFLRYAMVR